MIECLHTLSVASSYNRNTGDVGIGIIIRERRLESKNSPIIEEIKEAHIGIGDGRHDVFAILRAIQIAILRNYKRIRISSDSGSLRRAIQRALERPQTVKLSNQNIRREEILGLSCNFDSIDFSSISRRKNGRAHQLARKVIGMMRRKRGDEPEGMALWELGIENEIRKFEQTMPEEPELEDYETEESDELGAFAASFRESEEYYEEREHNESDAYDLPF